MMPVSPSLTVPTVHPPRRERRLSYIGASDDDCFARNVRHVAREGPSSAMLSQIAITSARIRATLGARTPSTFHSNR